jgi:hypothetical protein
LERRVVEQLEAAAAALDPRLGNPTGFVNEQPQ